MHDRGAFWSAPPTWNTAELVGRDVRVTVHAPRSIWIASGDVDAVLRARDCAAPVGPREVCTASRYALRLGPDRVLLISETYIELRDGWQTGVALSELHDGMLVFEMTGPGGRALLAQGTEYDFESTVARPLESSRMLFGGLKVAMMRRGTGWRLHVERLWAPALWRWLQAHMD
jgi:heterotetrameric sarcosine oxidase gamma subunit